MRDAPGAPSLAPKPPCGGENVSKRRRDMPKVSRETASETITLEGLEVQLEHLDGGYSVCFESHTADADLADLFRGLPDDRCPLGLRDRGEGGLPARGPRGDVRGGRRL